MLYTGLSPITLDFDYFALACVLHPPYLDEYKSSRFKMLKFRLMNHSHIFLLASFRMNLPPNLTKKQWCFLSCSLFPCVVVYCLYMYILVFI